MTGDARSINVSCTGGSYEVQVGRGLIDQVGAIVAEATSSPSACVICDSNVAPLYGGRVTSSLERSGIEAHAITFPAGERHKRHETLFDMLERMAQAQITRDCCVVALGGGVTGDMAGLAAALYLRGIKLVQVPTTLLAMVDSSVGGKTAIDLEAGKNLAGAFLQPSAVIADPDVLVTLPRAQLRDSCGEIVKHAAIADAVMLDEITAAPLLSDSLDLDRLCGIVADNVDIKRAVVEADEFESGVRKTLNFGHTIGHAIEAASDFRLGHGTCVGIGMCAIAKASRELGWCETDVPERIRDALSAHGLPAESTLDAHAILPFVGRDKKRRADSTSLAIVDRIGHATTRDVGSGELVRIVEMALEGSEGAS